MRKKKQKNPELFRQRVEQQIFAKKKNDIDWSFIDHLLCKTYGWDFWVLQKQPVPFVGNLLFQIVEEVKREKREMEKARKKKR